MLWLALHLPLLPLEARNCSSPSEAGRAASLAAVAARGRILVASAEAAAAGVTPGLGLSSALGLAPGLQVLEHDPARTQAAFHSLACWAGQFTPQVSLVPPATLLLEVGGCLRLFSGLDNLLALVREAGAAQGFTLATAVAPTALGATWLAWAGDGALCPDLPALHQALGKLPCTVPAWDDAVRGKLRAFGLTALDQVLALPRAELARRVGPEPVLELAKARGEMPDPRPWFPFPEKFAQSLELPAKVEAAEMLVFAGQRLLAALGGWLAARGAGVTSCLLRLEHEGEAVTEVSLRPAAATRDEGRLVRLLRERLARLQLTAPVQALELRAEETVTLAGVDQSLFAGEGSEAEGALLTLERLRARLGENQVFILTAQPDYRPECATGRAAPTGRGGGDVPGSGQRPLQPLWLLPEPRPLTEVDGRPQWAGGLTLLAGPERLESGWWDEGEAVGDVRRDYFVARNKQGQCLWIYRDAGGWFLHGLFP